MTALLKELLKEIIDLIVTAVRGSDTLKQEVHDLLDKYKKEVDSL